MSTILTHWYYPKCLPLQSILQYPWTHWNFLITGETSNLALSLDLNQIMLPTTVVLKVMKYAPSVWAIKWIVELHVATGFISCVLLLGLKSVPIVQCVKGLTSMISPSHVKFVIWTPKSWNYTQISRCFPLSLPKSIVKVAQIPPFSMNQESPWSLINDFHKIQFFI